MGSHRRPAYLQSNTITSTVTLMVHFIFDLCQKHNAPSSPSRAPTKSSNRLEIKPIPYNKLSLIPTDNSNANLEPSYSSTNTNSHNISKEKPSLIPSSVTWSIISSFNKPINIHFSITKSYNIISLHTQINHYYVTTSILFG